MPDKGKSFFCTSGMLETARVDLLSNDERHSVCVNITRLDTMRRTWDHTFAETSHKRCDIFYLVQVLLDEAEKLPSGSWWQVA